MKKQILWCFSVFILTISTTYSQTALSSSQEEISIPEIEKTYLHIDRSYYNIGESLWYKTYSVYAYNNLLFDKSNILYVELISPDSKIIARNKTRLEEGLGHGDFKLTDSVGVKPGVYQIRAYTNWSRNFDKDFVFKKEIEIMDVLDRDASKTNKESKADRKKINNKAIEKPKYTFNTQFFPEGGSLIENIISIVAFKAVDNNGLPILVKGKIFDSDENLVALTESVHDGMGKFQLKPTEGKAYYAKFMTLNGEEIEFPLPKVNKRGYLLSVKSKNGKHIVTIKTNQETLAMYPDAPVTVIGATRAITYFEGTQSLNSTTLSFEFPETDFPEGISQITLYDANARYQSERLLYIEKNNDVKVEIATDKKVYKTKEKVIVAISSKTFSGEAVPASFSLSSTDMNGVSETKNYGTNISSYFLMESDIRGKVYNPGYYFDRSNPKRLDYLDLLLLTQGWRDFLWKKMPEINDSLAYKVEKGITIAGKVKQLFGNKEKPDSNVTLVLYSIKEK
ncbi:hypothetical protein [Thalassobellus suaedae]|uniref:Macroglobulin domain-containing protein n=1 Tax=Thalassobellus suaedae TaxID=3074124 RepID=A0ABY9XS15_9FLAO|nr:hypothetical protein RHP51_16750 [Flavobacteriaceae bacterium HL-DH14]